MKTIHLNFLGKDSVPFDGDVEVSDKVYSLLQKFTANKKPTDKIFSNANSGTVTTLLNVVVPGLTPKNLRTVKANQEFVDEAKHILKTFTPKTEIEKVRVLYLANKKVAEKLNHQRNIAKNYSESKEKLEEKIKQSKLKSKEKFAKIKEKEKALDIQEKEIKRLFKADSLIFKSKMAELSLKREKLKLQKTKTEYAVEKANFNLEKKTGTKEIALSTSLASYLDPRIVFSLCQELDLDPGKIYTKRQLELFDYASDTGKEMWKQI